jgi:hypothetical protein
MWVQSFIPNLIVIINISVLSLFVVAKRCDGTPNRSRAAGYNDLYKGLKNKFIFINRQLKK